MFHNIMSCLYFASASDQGQAQPVQVLDIQGAGNYLGVPVTSVLHLKGVAKLAYLTEGGVKVWKVTDLAVVKAERAKKASPSLPVIPNCQVIPASQATSQNQPATSK